MYTETIKRMEKELAMLEENFKGFVKKGAISLFEEKRMIAKFINTKDRVNNLRYHATLNGINAAMKGTDGIIDLEKKIQQKKKEYERMRTILKMPMTDKQREEFVKKMKVRDFELKQLKFELMKQCEIKFPKMAEIMGEIQAYWDIQRFLLSYPGQP